MKKVMFTIFGSKGFIGKNIVNYLNKNNLKSYLPKKNNYIFKRNLGNIIYCIGKDQVLKNPNYALKANLTLIYKILLNNKFKSFTFLSSARVYLGNKKTSEQSDILIKSFEPNFQYNLLKLTAENFCLSLKNSKIRVIRLSNIYGNNFSKQDYLLPNLIREAVNNNRIKIYINKNSQKNYLSIDDAISLIFKIIRKGKFRLYNVASDRMIKINNIAKLIQKHSNCRIIYQNQNIKINEPTININRIKSEFKFKPTSYIIDDLEGIIKNFKN